MNPSLTILTSVRRALPVMLLLLASIVIGCSDTPTDNSGNNTTTEEKLTSAYYIQANINGKVETQQVATKGAETIGIYSYSSGGSGTRPGYLLVQTYTFQKIINVGFPPLPDTSYRAIEISVIKNFADQPYDSEKDSLITTPSMTYGSIEKEIDGVEIAWKDANGVQWSTSKGSGDQSGSSFTITSHERINYQIGQAVDAKYITKGTFSCTLYNDSGNSMTVTNGKFSLRTIW